MDNNLLLLKMNDVEEILRGAELDIIELVKETYIQHYLGYTSLPHSVFLRFPNNDRNRIIGLPAYLSSNIDVAGFKWISSFPENTENNIERASAIIALNNLSNGRVKAVMEGSIISAKRTAASAAVAAEIMHSNPFETQLGVVGCGRINREIVHFLITVFKSLEYVTLYDLDQSKAESLSLYIVSRYPRIKTKIVDHVDQVFEKASLISVATTAGEPFLHMPKILSEGSTILDISLRDFFPSFIYECDNIVDDIDHVCREKTSMELTEKKYGSRNFIRGTLADVLLGRISRRTKGKTSVFSPFGLGVLDLALSEYVYNIALNNKSGIKIENFYD